MSDTTAAETVEGSSPSTGVTMADVAGGLVGTPGLDRGGARGAAVFHTLGALLVAAAATRAGTTTSTCTRHFCLVYCSCCVIVCGFWWFHGGF